MVTMAVKLDYYEVLGVSRTAASEEISSAYRRLAVKHHPDKNPGDDRALARFKQAAEAFEVLSDKNKRARYDHYGHAGVESLSGGAPHFTDVEDIFSAFGDIFGDIFGGGRRSGRGSSKGRDIRVDVTLDLREAASGSTKTLEFDRHVKCDSCDGSGAHPEHGLEVCSYCQGRGQVIQSTGIIRMQITCPSCHGKGELIKKPCKSCRGEGYRIKPVMTEVNIPAGVDDGMRVRMPGQGEPSPNGGPPGDCYCFISLLEHPLFERQAQDLICRVPITYSQAALGVTLEVPTLNGREELAIPAGSHSGDVFRLRGRGMPDPRRRGLGDLVVQVNIEVPKKLTPREQELLRELAEEEHVNVAPHRRSFFEKLKNYFKAGDAVDESEVL